MAARPRKNDPRTAELAATLPPHNPEAERFLIGAVLVEPGILPKLARMLNPEHFLKKAHQRIYRAALDLTNNGQPVDLVSVKSMLDDRRQLADCGSASYLAELFAAVPTAANYEFHSSLVRDSAMRRDLIHTITVILRDAHNGMAPVVRGQKLYHFRGHW